MGWGSEQKGCKIFDLIVKNDLVAYSALFVWVNAVGRHVTTKWTITQFKTLMKLFKYSRDFFLMRLSPESPLIQSLTKERKVSPVVLLRSDDFDVGYPPPPPSHYLQNNKNNLFCDCNVQMSFES